MIGFRWLSELLTVAPLQLGAEVERSTKRRRAAARLNTSVTNRAQGVAAGINDRSYDPDAQEGRAARRVDAIDEAFRKVRARDQ